MLSLYDTILRKIQLESYPEKILYSGLLFRYAAKMVLEKNPKNKIIFLKKLFSKINYNKMQKLNLHTPEISSFSDWN